MVLIPQNTINKRKENWKLKESLAVSHHELSKPESEAGMWTKERESLYYERHFSHSDQEFEFNQISYLYLYSAHHDPPGLGT